MKYLLQRLAFCVLIFFTSMMHGQWKVESFQIDSPGKQPMWCAGCGASYSLLVKASNQSGTWREEWERKWLFQNGIRFNQQACSEGWMNAHAAVDYVCNSSLGIFYSKKINSPQGTVHRIFLWDGEQERALETIFHDGDDIHPAWDEEEKMLFFASNRSGGNGGFDLYRMHWNGVEWSQIAHLDNAVNSTQDEKFCAIWRSDLYFSSIREEGDWEIFKAPREGAWSLRWQMEAPINSEFDDFQWVPFDDFSGGLMSNRDNNQINLFVLRGETPKKLVYMELEDGYHIEMAGGTCLSSEDPKKNGWLIPINTPLSFVLLDHQNNVVPFGFIIIRDEWGRPLAQGITNERGLWSWSYISATFSPLSLMSTDDLSLLVGGYEKIEVQEINDLNPNISFGQGSSELSIEQMAALDHWADFLINRKLNVKIQGFTDSKGSMKYNQKLAFQRALNVQSYLIKKGVSISQVTVQEEEQEVAHLKSAERKVSLTIMP
jgi:flagellar motor protein MotB